MILKQIALSLLIGLSRYSGALAATNPQDTIVVNQRELRPCRDTTYLIEKAYATPLLATIVRVRPSGWLYIHCPTISKHMNLEACYLPLQASEEGLVILITGNVLEHPKRNGRSSCRPTLQFQLTSLKVVRQ